jgi:O-antigen ligase/tetratricopeptide (TPR) repeat protein
VVSVLDGISEGIIYLILVATPWLLGGYHPKVVHFACIGLGVILLLWAIKQVVLWRLKLHLCTVSALLIILFVVSSCSLIALPRPVLQSLSPQAAKLYDVLLPAEREQATFNTPAEPLPFEPGTTLSLVPGVTQAQLVELLAAILLFLVVRHSLASPERLQRLAWVLLINGTLLAIFGLIQRVRSQTTMVYGQFVVAEVFGPFINRNHFPSYVNFCICLGLGLFLRSMQGRGGKYQRSTGGQKVPVSYATGGWSEILQHPLAVWVLIPVAVCITAVMASLSRGGILAMVVALVMAALLWRRRTSTQSAMAILLIPVLALGILLWYGAAPTIERFENEEYTEEGRFTIWKASLAAFQQFPWVGSGLGTFPFVEPLYRPATANQTMIHLHAHNEYMEALVEGGIIRLLITLALVFLVLRIGWKALDPRRGTPEPALILGCWAGCVTLAVQSFGEFGIHMPAIVATLAVVAGMLVGISPQRPSGDDETLLRWNFFGIGPVIAVVFAGTLALVLFVGSRLNWEGEGYREFGLQLTRTAKEKTDLETYSRAVNALDNSIRFAPGLSRYRVERNDIENQRLSAWEAHYREVFKYGLFVQETAILLHGFSQLQGQPLLSLCEDGIKPFLLKTGFSNMLRDQQVASWKQQYHHYLAARDLCPISLMPHLEIARHVLPGQANLAEVDRQTFWAKAEPQSKYLDRMKLLYPQRADTWYLTGELEWLRGERDKSLASWKKSLDLSDNFLDRIVTTVAFASLQPQMKLSTSEIMTRLLPARHASYFVKTAWILYPGAAQSLDRKPFMDEALRLLEKQDNLLEPEQQYTYGLAKWGINQREQAVQHLMVAVRAKSHKLDWKMDLARLFFELEKFSDCREQLNGILMRKENNVEALLLLKKLDELQRPEEKKERKE